jgi:hypothetical protein
MMNDDGTVTMTARSDRGRVYSADFDLRDLGDLESGKTKFIAAKAHHSVDDEVGGLVARQDQILARLTDMAAEHPELLEDC